VMDKSDVKGFLIRLSSNWSVHYANWCLKYCSRLGQIIDNLIAQGVASILLI
jgi:hypothetical protein